ncbi:sodium:solute symporter [Bacillus sp. ISL-40]|uniref:sodium:solute symporter family protein n=1 Tax=unclassified Bacillus (in: firmicutes) TaxID=185979 RepID=UPI001BE732B2|nr:MULTISPECIES: sodium:solute symporter [unclassified Bacillus (in: firmicutes)]MBT2695936.1 sodium:solute symporter [Bacillus sp. ISL-40]MBT2722779.1 sodium:solute symporter [Bacillus sp. ISL-46]MBT2739708.1 sodium:solute symporter [Bacillus sp. ISL-77]
MNSAIFILIATLLLAFYLGVRARKGQQLEEWAVGGRNFGSITMFVLMAGEIFTTYVFLGGSGGSYRMGGPIIYIFNAFCYIVPFWILPPIWRYAKKHRVITQSDFFAKKYDSKPLGLLVAIVGVVSMIPYIVLQLKGLKIIVSETSYGAISPNLAVCIGVVAVTIFVTLSGIHGSASTAILKDILLLVVILFLGIYLPYHYYGGIKPMFETLDAAKPEFLLIPKEGYSISWYISTCLTIGLGQYMWPQCFGASLSSKNERTLRQNAAILPLYQIILVFILFIGFTALLQIPNLQGADTDLALFKIAKATFDPWVVGVIGAAGILTALVPCSMLLLTASTILSKNIYKAIKPNTTDEQIGRYTRRFVPIVALIALFFTFFGGNSIIALLIMAYSFVLQLFPPLLCSLWKKNPVTKTGASAGIIAGVIMVAYVTITSSTMGTFFPEAPSFIKDLDIGIAALVVNIVFMFAVSAFTRTLVKVETEIETKAV